MSRLFRIALIAMFTLSFGASAWAHTLQEIFALRWVGTSVQVTDFTESGKFVAKQRFDMRLDSDNRVSGTAYTTFTLDGTTYNATLAISGRYDPSGEKMDFRATLTRGDALPHGLVWCGSSGPLHFYNDSGRPGHYVMKGTLTADCGGTVEVELIDE